MNRISRTLMAVAALSVGPAAAALPAGAAAPDFEAQAALDGKRIDFKLAEARSSGPVVVYFYPAAYTGGCNIQARAFSQQHEHFAAAGARVVGVSLDGIERLQRFSADPDYCAGKFPVVSDADGRIAGRYELRVSPGAPGFTNTRGEVIGHGFAERTTFVVAPDGHIAATISGLGPELNVRKALDEVRGLKAPSGK